MERTVILAFIDTRQREKFINAFSPGDCTLHKEAPIVYCRLTREEVEKAVRDFNAKDISCQYPPSAAFSTFLDELSHPG